MTRLKCVGCKERFPKEAMIKLPCGNVHSIECATQYAQRKQTERQAAKAAKASTDTRKRQKAERSKHRADKLRVKTKAKWLAELQAVVNKYVRLRDAADGCMSCDKPSDWQGQWHASHYYSRGHSSALRFNLWNIHKSCSVCNSKLSGNIGNYTPRLIEKIGADRYAWLGQHKSDIVRRDVEWIRRAIKIARRAVRRLEVRGG